MKSIRFIILLLFLSFDRQVLAQNTLTSNGAQITLTTGSSLHVNGDSHFLAGSTFTSAGSFSTSGTIQTDPTLTDFVIETLDLNGTSTQTIEGSSTILVKNVVVDNASGIILKSPLKVDNHVLFTKGTINTASASAALILTNNATITGASDQSHVAGHIQREGIGTFSYPVGNGNKLQPITVNLDENSSGFRVKYFDSNAGTATFSTSGASHIALESYNTQEYWDLTPIGTASGTVTIFWDATNNAPITTSENQAVFKVAHKTISGWQNEGSALVTGDLNSGSVTSRSISSWSPFTLGAVPEASLPVTLIDFRARLVENQMMITWTTTQETNASHFELERSLDARHYEVIGKINAIGNSVSTAPYLYVDASFPSSVEMIYYRLRAVDADGSFSHSQSVSVKTPNLGYLSSVYPNPVRRDEAVIVASNTQVDQITVYNLLGSKASIKTKRLDAKRIEINPASLGSGVYFIRVDSDNTIIHHRLVVH